ncbi:acyl-CoA dehydrogenase family protein [Amycolatopsis cihanbeyliensis]|uniref:Alkylation response protein AidB-like acyl-CoA dehydrogenase n=1 Tax=Amycolatopsis cihanbeyliensis TaxID=1128664 RepID=A0A542DR53_AMYCI|nr:acyl-CoA dehydrogenase family protein [Amycolatopsis cihanbeyliensis]TQJ05588.1 alkylation response protein AidB-like acyl-CoA dehydrogenase [Amycolatopsis cihanbeyliensis]
MKRCLTDRQREFVDMAAGLADRFAERAAEHDRDNSFPYENYEDMREAGFLRISLPEELGGLGGGMADILPAIERLAMGDGATALAVNMHISPLGQWSSVWRRTGDERLAKFLRLAAEDKLVWAAVTSEIGTPNLMTDARTTASRVEGGYLLNGRKNFGTNTSVATHCSTTARYEDPELGPRLMLFRVALDDPAVTIHQTWDMMGMRATQSNDVEYKDLFVPDESLVHSLPVGYLDARVMETVFAWAMPAFGAVYSGVAAGALDWAKRQVIRRGLATSTRVQDTVAECEILLESSRSVLYRHADEFGSRRALEELTVQEGLSRCALVKYVCTNNATEIFSKLVDAVGGASYVRKLPFERMWRDVQAGLFMPFANYAAKELIGATALDVELAPST